MEIADEKLQRLFDLILGSMDFGSCFLETDDVVLLREIAKEIGVDPFKATPENFRSQYNHDFEAAEPNRFWRDREFQCKHCNLREEAPCHKGEMKE